jgi:16S rRNA (adenine1518-N6/adenine1519-N6)-dimethyltransferase
MFQKEVAQRAAADPGSKTYGVLSALMQPYYQITYLFDVGPEKFTPPPKVNSGVILLKRKSFMLDVKSERAYWVLVKTAFNQRRKTMRNAVKSLFPAEVLKDPIFDKRAEVLSIEEFAALTHRMS